MTSTLPSQLCAHYDDTSTHLDCSAMFKTDRKKSSHTCPLTLQLRITYRDLGFLVFIFAVCVSFTFGRWRSFFF